ncbi:MAG: RnfABCDGE type electron transport complex subunit D, partial [Defluviitaleaceae bacterium]|nr:RnfABCDGE type electron transport complex subunit D [Defluviitaleaceae bacterium]
PLNPSGWYGGGVDAIVGATPIAYFFASNDWIPNSAQLQNFFSTFWSNMIFGNSYGAVAETSRLAIIIALIYMTYKKVLDWAIPVFYFVTIFIIALIFALIMPYETNVLLYSILHLLVGGVMFGAVFMLTDPVTIPINRQGRVIFAILVGSFTMLIRLATSHNEGVAFAILLVNILVPIIDRQTSNLTHLNTNKKWLSIGATFGVSALVVLLFARFI